VTQGVLSMTRKVQMVTSKLDQAHGKAREIEAIVIASIAFDNRYCHALTLNRDLVVFDLLGALETYNLERRGRPAPGGAVCSGGASCRGAGGGARSSSTGGAACRGAGAGGAARSSGSSAGGSRGRAK